MTLPRPHRTHLSLRSVHAFFAIIIFILLVLNFEPDLKYATDPLEEYTSTVVGTHAFE